MSRDTRAIIEEAVAENRGINFTGLKEETGLSNGVLQYHIRNSDKLVKKKGAILRRETCDECSFCGLCRDKCLHRVLREEEKRRIVEGLAAGEPQKEIAEELGLDKSTVSYHVRDLRESGVLDDENSVVEDVRESDWISV